MLNNKSLEKSLFPHQKEAIEKWLYNDKRGILEMATGTGKTFTAINCLKILDENTENLITVIACPFSHLVSQWENEVKFFNISRSYEIYGVNSNWKKDLSKLCSRIKRGSIKKAIIFTTHKTFSSDFFKTKFGELNTNLFLIADEMHHLGSKRSIQALLPNYKFRLGLSATPSKFMDEEATDYLLEYFGGVVYKFTLTEALLKRNPKTLETYLTPYFYFPKKVNLTQEEISEYKKLTKTLAGLLNHNYSDEKEENINSVLRKRRDILNNAEGKYWELRKILRSYEDLDHLIVFCSHKQIDKVLEILKEEGVYPRHRFTSKQSSTKLKKLGGYSEREKILRDFDNGYYKAIVAIKCLDEGVDVPSADKVIIMSSTTNPMEYIQRRGRVLRRFKGKEFAYIYDMMVVPDDDGSYVDTIIENELKRLSEFIKISKNSKKCNELLQKWGVLI